MKQIYNFEQYTPPALNETVIRAELEKRQLRRQTILFVLAGVLLQFAILLFGISAAEIYPLLSVSCFLYVLMTMACSIMIAIVYAQKGDETL